jgi:hypothetical protein
MLWYPFLGAVAHGSAAAWRHFNLLGEYDFSEEKLQDSIRDSAPKIDELNRVLFWGAPKIENPIYERDYAKSHVAFGTFVGI